MEEAIIRFRWPIILGFTALTLFFAFQLPRARIQADLETYIPDTVPARLNTDAIDKVFGGSDMLMVLLETDDVLNPATLKRVGKLSRQFKRIKGVNQVLSLFDSKNIHGEDGMMIVDPAVKRLPRTPEEREALRNSLKSNDLVYGLVVSMEFDMTAILISIDDDVSDLIILQDVKDAIANVPGDETVRIGGLPETRASISNDIARDFILLMPLALILMLLTLLLTFRQLRGVLLPFAIVIMSIIFSMGFQVMIGWDLTILAILLPVMMIAIANNYGIHLIARYQEMDSQPEFHSRNDLVKAVVLNLKMPVLLTGLTTIAGILGLLSHVLIPARQLGVMAAVGIAYALILSLFFIPALLSMMKRPREGKNRTQSERNADSKLLYLGNMVAGHPRRILRIVSGTVLFLLLGVFFLKVDSNMINFFPRNHPTHIAAELINRKFGGSEHLSVMVEGDIRNPDVLRQMDAFSTELESMPDVGDVTSLATVIKAMSRALNDPDEAGYNRIPDTREAVSQYLELYNMSGDPEDFEKIVDFNYEHAQIMIRIKNSDASAIKAVVARAEDLASRYPSIRFAGGQSMITAELIDIVVRGQMISLFLAIIVIALMVMLMFRSPTAGLLATVPLLVAIILLFGLMGYLGIRLDIVTAILSSIMIGVGVDYTIHFLWRYQQERKRGLDYREAVVHTLVTTGRGITFNALSVMIGFAALLVSMFPPLKFFGFLVVVSIFACAVGAMVLVPALCLVYKPKFLEPDQDRNKEDL